jgi:hypothetical protein
MTWRPGADRFGSFVGRLGSDWRCGIVSSTLATVPDGIGPAPNGRCEPKRTENPVVTGDSVVSHHKAERPETGDGSEGWRFDSLRRAAPTPASARVPSLRGCAVDRRPSRGDLAANPVPVGSCLSVADHRKRHFSDDHRETLTSDQWVEVRSALCVPRTVPCRSRYSPAHPSQGRWLERFRMPTCCRYGPLLYLVSTQ